MPLIAGGPRRCFGPSNAGGPMTSFRSCAVLLAGLVVSILSGCARASQPSETQSLEPAEEPSTAVVSAEDIASTSGETIERVLMRKFPGVWIVRTDGGGISVRIRGTSSFYGSNEPLYVLDGVPLHAGRNGSLVGLNPYDIETIKVLKNPADTGMYGIRGANGVIVITTKRP